ncbi:MAG: TadE/TadG family type IV pilus assembly protein [Pseudomonadota bacterium]
MQSSLQARLRRFPSDESGALGIIFAVALIPLLLVIGIATDYGRASSIKASLQDDLDAAVVEGARRLAMTANPAKATEAAKRFYINSSSAKRISDPKFSANKKSGAVTADASYDVATTFLSLAGLTSLKVSASAAATAKPPKSKTNQAKRIARPSMNTAAPQLDERDIEDLVYRVDQLCRQLSRYGAAARVPQCQAVFNGSFEKSLRSKLASNDNVDELLPAGVRLLK